ncbi:uncharacterized protein [Triticum aestivum]|uniref:uncharacterized protein n=1 Tax=Triticum aestivum TaxID=4565 RepID=UPI001D009405|nr:uncharacterized protein LOC123157618 [Triticum aestivum]
MEPKQPAANLAAAAAAEPEEDEADEEMEDALLDRAHALISRAVEQEANPNPPHGDSSRSSRRVPQRQGNMTIAAKAGVTLEIPNGAVLENKRLTVKQEGQAPASDVEAAYTTQTHATYNHGAMGNDEFLLLFMPVQECRKWFLAGWTSFNRSSGTH